MLRPIDLDQWTRTLWAECRGEPLLGQRAVAFVIFNRYKRPGWWSRQKDDIPDDTIQAVVRDKAQFSCWFDSQLYNLLQVPTTDPVYVDLWNICLDVWYGVIEDPTKGATHYHTLDSHPDWSRGLQPCLEIGNHRFFNNVP